MDLKKKFQQRSKTEQVSRCICGKLEVRQYGAINSYIRVMPFRLDPADSVRLMSDFTWPLHGLNIHFIDLYQQKSFPRYYPVCKFGGAMSIYTGNPRGT